MSSHECGCGREQIDEVRRARQRDHQAHGRKFDIRRAQAGAADGAGVTQMPIAPEQFWRSNYYRHPPLTDEMVEIAERQLGVKIPIEFLALLRIQNGGYVHPFAYPMTVPTTWAKDHVPLHDLFGIVVDPQMTTAQNILMTAYMTDEWGLPPKQVLLTGDGHWWITLDYRRGPVPSVAWIDVECNEDIQVAPSFAAFLDGLVPQSHFDNMQS